jgi:hypothetical protein
LKEFRRPVFGDGAKQLLQKTTIILAVFLLTLAFSTICAFNQAATANAQTPSIHLVQSNSQVPTTIDVQPSDDTVFIGVWLLNMFDFQYKSGSYTMDMYTYFFWTNPNITNIDWYFSNGYPINPTAVTLVANTTSGDFKVQVYRATARLNYAPDAVNYPFDHINITVSIDLLTQGNDVVLQWLTNETGVDSQFTNSGWKTDSIHLHTSLHPYPIGVEVPRAEMVLNQQRQRTVTSFSPFVPPAIFTIVCAVSFLFSLKEMSSVGLRVGLNTSMLVTTLLFSFGASNDIPPSSYVVLYTIFLLCVLIFMVCNLIVTIVGVVGWLKYKDERRTTLANRLGFVISVIVPMIIFFVLYYGNV